MNIPIIMEEKGKRMTLKEKEDEQEQERLEIAKMIYIRWKIRKLMQEKQMTIEKARQKALLKWGKMDEEKMLKFYRIASIECHMLNEDECYGKKKKIDVSKRKEEHHPYLLFCKDHRDKVKSEGHSGNEVMKVLSEMWKELPEEIKNKYREIAKVNKGDSKK